MISELSRIITILEQINARIDRKIVTSQEITEANNSIMELYQNLELLMETIKNVSDVDTSISKTLVHLNKHFVRVMQYVEDIRDLTSFALERYRLIQKMKLES